LLPPPNSFYLDKHEKLYKNISLYSTKWYKRVFSKTYAKEAEKADSNVKQ
jgi:hypothetical protein